MSSVDLSQMVLSSRQMVGASATEDGLLKVLYCEEIRSKAAGGRPKVQYRLKKSDGCGI